MTRVGAQIIGVGKSPAGIAPVSPYSTAPTKAIAAEVQYLGQSADYNEIPADPIDVDVALSLSIPRGSCRHAPDLGNLLHTISPLGQPDEQQRADEYVRTSNPLAQRIAAGDVTIRSVDTQHAESGLIVTVGYRNMRRNPNQTLLASNS
jgi:hypothetical protein